MCRGIDGKEARYDDDRGAESQFGFHVAPGLFRQCSVGGSASLEWAAALGKNLQGMRKVVPTYNFLARRPGIPRPDYNQ